MTDPPPPEAPGPPSSPSPDYPEQGWLVRWRSWRDAFPSLLLLDAVRPATWLSLLVIGSLAYWASAVASAGLDRWTGRDTATVIIPSRPPAADGASVSVMLATLLSPSFAPDAEAVDTFLSPAYAVVADRSPGLPGLPLPRRPKRVSLWWMLLHRLVRLVIWAIPAGIALRYSVFSVAGRPRTGLGVTGRLATKRFFSLMFVLLIPLLAIGLASLFFLVPGWIARVYQPGALVAEALSALAVPLALAAGLFAFGSLFAFPLAWAAVMTERDGDPFDALSRGYEYAFRRPFHLIAYLLLAWLISRVLLVFANGICTAALVLSQDFFALANGSDASLAGMSVLHAYVTNLPSVFASLLFWTLVGGIYLLMRHATNGQEIEEIDESLANRDTMR